MKIAFVDFSEKQYRIESAYQIPLGGSQSGLCYLAEVLAKAGHEVFFFSRTLGSAISLQVHCLNLEDVPDTIFKSLDAIVVINTTYLANTLRSNLADHTSLVLWTGHAHDQAAIQELQFPEVACSYDAIVLVSHWQKQCICQSLDVQPDRTFVIGQAIAPSFTNLFPRNATILGHKTTPPTLFYTSTPFRGLDLLLSVFPKIQAAISGARLHIFSSMQVYQYQQGKDQAKFGHLYDQCREMDGVEYFGSIPQPELAQKLQSATALVYPNTFAETSCIAVMEAMASGCHVITSDLGALPDTTAGFAPLIPVSEDWETYQQQFTQATIETLQKQINDPGQTENHLRQQVDFVNNHYVWSKRAEEWIALLSGLRAYRAFMQQDYKRAIVLYNDAIETFPQITSNYWYLGLSLLLNLEVEEAYWIWTAALLSSDSEGLSLRQKQLMQVLEQGLNHCYNHNHSQGEDLLQQAIINLFTGKNEL
jgi:glycosyltransferase involved in cell wall biosynthesis